MASESRSSFRFRDRISSYKDKIKDKAIKRNITLFVEKNFTSDQSDEEHSHSRFGFRQKIHHAKEILKNKTHYEEIKDKIKDKIEPHDNQSYPKGFYDSLFSPESENDYYVTSAVICLVVIAFLVIIPTIILTCFPERKEKKTKKSTSSSSINMIFFHIFICELCYLVYILFAMINVGQDFHLNWFACDIANYGMYISIPIMQFALLFLSLERLSRRRACGTISWMQIFQKSYVIQLILWGIWAIFLAVVFTIRFIRHQFSFNVVRDQIDRFSPPLIGNVLDKIASRRYHCSIDGRLSSIFKTAIIVLFVILIVKPILVSFGVNFLTCGSCRGRKPKAERPSERRKTILVTIFILFNFFFSFPFYFVSMFNSILTQIDSTKETFNIVLRICFILRITNIIFECLAFQIFDYNSWRFLCKCLFILTCKKVQVFDVSKDDDRFRSKNLEIQKNLDEAEQLSEKEDEAEPTDDQNEAETTVLDENDNDDEDGGMAKKSENKTTFRRHRTEENERLIPKDEPKRKNTLTEEETQMSSDKEEEEENPRPPPPRQLSHSKSADRTRQTSRVKTTDEELQPEKTRETNPQKSSRPKGRKSAEVNRQNSQTRTTDDEESKAVNPPELIRQRSQSKSPETHEDKHHSRTRTKDDDSKVRKPRESFRRSSQKPKKEISRQNSPTKTTDDEESKVVNPPELTRQRSQKRSSPEPHEDKHHSRTRTKDNEVKTKNAHESFRRSSGKRNEEAVVQNENPRHEKHRTTTNETKHRRDKSNKRTEHSPQRRTSVSSANEEPTQKLSVKTANGRTRSRSPAPVRETKNHQKKKSKVRHQEKIEKMSDAV